MLREVVFLGAKNSYVVNVTAVHLAGVTVSNRLADHVYENIFVEVGRGGFSTWVRVVERESAVVLDNMFQCHNNW